MVTAPRRFGEAVRWRGTCGEPNAFVPLKAMKCGLARQSVGGVPPLEGTVEGGGFPHEQLHQEETASPFRVRHLCPFSFIEYTYCFSLSHAFYSDAVKQFGLKGIPVSKYWFLGAVSPLLRWSNL